MRRSATSTPPEPEMPGEADRLMVDAFHQATIARDNPGAVIDEVIAEGRVQMPLGHGHADRHGESLPQRTGGAFRAFEVRVFRMPGARTAQLTETADLVHCRMGIAGQMKQRIEQHRAVTG